MIKNGKIHRDAMLTFMLLLCIDMLVLLLCHIWVVTFLSYILVTSVVLSKFYKVYNSVFLKDAVFKSGWAISNVVGIICPLGWNRVN